jgi:pimeloyl-ACP methyl ester carboxylesterase
VEYIKKEVSDQVELLMRTRKIMLLFVLCVWITGCRQVNTTTIINPEPALKATKSPTTSSSATHNLTPEQQVTPATASPDIKVKGLVKIGDHPLFINCSGSGTPTVVLEAGWNDTSDTWSEVQAAVDDFTRVCSYDRAGLGRSPAGPEPRTLDKEAAELYQLLEEAGVNGPSILVGHSYGGMLVRLFTDQHAEQVAGMVLVDSPHPDIYRRSLAVLPPESPDENEGVQFYREWFTQEIE